MVWFLFSRPSVQFSVTSINRSRRGVALNWMSCLGKKADNSRFSWIVQEQPYRHHSAWEIRTTGYCYKVGLDIPLIYDFLPNSPLRRLIVYKQSLAKLMRTNIAVFCKNYKILTNNTTRLRTIVIWSILFLPS